MLLFVLLLVFGTQMPGAWRQGVEHKVHAPFALSSWAHFVLFGLIAWVLAVRPLARSVLHVLLLALGLALLTEGLQFFAVDRHPRLIDIAIDMAGTLSGLLIAGRLRRAPAAA